MALEHFPREALRSDRVFDMGYAGLHKRQILPEECDAPARQLFHFFNSRPMLEFLEGADDDPGADSRPLLRRRRLSRDRRGGKLGIHADFRINEQLHLHRRLNVIIYLNEGWRPEWGGALELWDREMTAKVREVLPVFNRCVIFNTDADSFHGHPDPLATPEGVFRRSIALYYYTASQRDLQRGAEHLDDVPRPSGRRRVGAARSRRCASTSTCASGCRPRCSRYVFAVARRLRK